LNKRLWPGLLLTLAALQILGAAIAFVRADAGGGAAFKGLAPPSWFILIPLGICSIAGFWLLMAGRDDGRAVSLGIFFILLAAPFSNRWLMHFAQTVPAAWSWPILLLRGLQVDSFFPYFFWRFTRDFPDSSSSPRLKKILSGGSRASLVIAVALVAWQLGLNIQAFQRALELGLRPAALAPPKPSWEHYGFLVVATVAALVVLLWRARAAQGEERRRVGMFVGALTLGITPLFSQIALGFVIPAYGRWLDQPSVGLKATAVTFAFFLTLPFTTAYSVLVDHVLGVKLIARRALQYALARYTALGLATVPLAALAIYLIENRDQSLAQLFSGAKALLLISAAIVGGAALRYRAMILDGIDRRFFREQYDARKILTSLVERIRAVNEVGGLASLVSREVDLALHLEGISLLALDDKGVLVDPRNRARRLDGSCPLALMVSNASDPLEVDLENPRSPLGRLPDKERHWLVDNGFKLLVPILARDGSLLGLIALGEKKSGLPFLKEDKQLLHAIASNSAWVLELEKSRSNPSRPPWREEDHTPPTVPDANDMAKECPACGTLHAPYTVFCSNCSHRLEPSHVPFVLPGKFRFERRIGTGGMGIVYRGFDLALGRAVAVKTLRRVSPEDAMRLRREARTAAAVSHLHLASVYNMETWQGTPFLILELLEGGTLGQRIEAQGRLSPLETVELGIAMAAALAHLHASDILHRDVKPSNIGYARDGSPKLMDFGIARVMFDLRRDTDTTSIDDVEDNSSILPPTSIWHQSSSSITFSRQLVGTLSYLSPEALNGRPADVSFDLWGLAIVLFECLLGRKVFSGGDVRQTMSRIRSGRVPDFSQVLPEYDEMLGDFFRAALHKNPARRPTTALELKQQLEFLRLRLAA
jgi:hypothetical protein